MTASLHPLPVFNENAREHITIPIVEFAAKLGGLIADAEDKGAKFGLTVAMADPSTHLLSAAVAEDTRELRSRLYGAQITALLRGLAK